MGFVDDRIPVDAKTEEPIWGMSTKHPWQLILLKFWAKKLGGYSEVKRRRPFEFIESFTNSNWKYFNLSKENKRSFLLYYKDKVKSGKFVLKTKNSNQV